MARPWGVVEAEIEALEAVEVAADEAAEVVAEDVGVAEVVESAVEAVASVAAVADGPVVRSTVGSGSDSPREEFAQASAKGRIGTDYMLWEQQCRQRHSSSSHGAPSW